MKVLAITQARTGSTRLPGKVLKTIGKQTLLDIHIHRILKSNKIDKLLIATTLDKADDAIEKIAAEHQLPCYRGSTNDVLDRFYQAAIKYNPEWIVRITSDCPLIDANLIDEVIDMALKTNSDYASNVLEPTFPNGTDVEVFKFSALETAWKNATLKSDREHVTPYIYRNSTFRGGTLFESVNYTNPVNYANVRMTVDEEADFNVISLMVEKVGLEKDWKTYADLYLSDPEIMKLNKNIDRNEGYLKSLKDDNK
ncbi:MAG: glycosyltransferase family protein [Bacteroidia bacterium]|nr:glycosyltransferase family protein [Bacteroidia bacterium]